MSCGYLDTNLFLIFAVKCNFNLFYFILIENQDVSTCFLYILKNNIFSQFSLSTFEACRQTLIFLYTTVLFSFLAQYLSVLLRPSIDKVLKNYAEEKVSCVLHIFFYKSEYLSKIFIRGVEE